MFLTVPDQREVRDKSSQSRILKLGNHVLVDNAWAAPKAAGCGGPLLSALIDPVINLASGLPSAPGNNHAVLENTLHVAGAASVRLNDAENP